MDYRWACVVVMLVPGASLAMDLDCTVAEGSSFARTGDAWDQSAASGQTFGFEIVTGDGGSTSLVPKPPSEGGTLTCAPLGSVSMVCTGERPDVFIYNLATRAFAILQAAGVATADPHATTVAGVGDCEMSG